VLLSVLSGQAPTVVAWNQKLKPRHRWSRPTNSKPPAAFWGSSNKKYYCTYRPSKQLVELPAQKRCKRRNYRSENPGTTTDLRAESDSLQHNAMLRYIDDACK
jgi:hypothetical protein